jgi:hypothetical protein
MQNSFLLLCLLFASAVISNAQILAWDFAGNGGNEVTVLSTTTAANLNVSTISRGAGINTNTLANAFSASAFNGATFGEAVTNEEYFQFTVSPQAGYQVSLSTLDVNFRRSGTGPEMFQWQYSLDGFATAGTNIGGAINFTDTATNGVAQPPIDLSGIGQLQNISFPTVVTFRLYGWGASAGSGTFALGRLTGNDLAVGGTVLPVLAASAQIGGRVRDAGGRGLGGVFVTVSGGGLEMPVSVMTNPFGYYRLEVPAGQTYILTVVSKVYSFPEPTRVINVNEDIDDLDFIAAPK